MIKYINTIDINKLLNNNIENIYFLYNPSYYFSV